MFGIGPASWFARGPEDFVVVPVFDTVHSWIYVTLEHKTSVTSLGYIYNSSQKYIGWVKIIDFSFMPKIIRY